jgi:hypothetical protein
MRNVAAELKLILATASSLLIIAVFQACAFDQGPTTGISQTPNPVGSGSSSSPERTNQDQMSGLTLSEQRAAVKRCTAAYQEWRREDLGESPAPQSKFALKVAAHTRSNLAGDTTTVVLTDGKTRLVCNTEPSNGLRYPARDVVSNIRKAETFWFSDSSTENYHLPPGELIWAGGRVSASVQRITYIFPDKRHASAVIGPDGYWVMHYVRSGSFAEDYNTLKPVMVRVVMKDGAAREFRIEWDEDGSCESVNYGGC